MRLKVLPESIDLRTTCSSVEDQGDLGSCTANALAGAVEFLEKKDNAKFIDASRLFIYYNERAIEGTISQDSGAMIRDGIKSLAKQGVCSEVKWPYDISKFTNTPTDDCYKEALNHQILSYYRIKNLDEMKNCPFKGYTCSWFSLKYF